MNTLLENIFGILFEPVKTFRNIDVSKPYKFPLATLIISAVFLFMLSDSILTFGGLFSKIISLVCYWLFLSFFINIIAFVFGFKDYFNKLLSLMAYSFLPWIFLAPLKLLTDFDGVIYSFAMILLFVVWIWTIALQVLAISETYNISRKNAIVLYIVPFLGTVLYFIWIMDFCVKLFQFSSF